MTHGPNPGKLAGDSAETGRVDLCTQMPSRPGDEARMDDGERLIIGELVKLLLAHPGGLRRWSVMQAIRVARNRSSQTISLKFESEIERVFRKFCAEGTESRGQENSPFLFYRPEGKAGEVWAVRPHQAAAWLQGAPDRRGIFPMAGVRS